MLKMKLLYSLAVLLVLMSCNSGQSASNANSNTEGERLFTTNCASCHKCDINFTGPALKGAVSRWKDKGLMYEFIRNPMGVIMKDEYAAGLQKKFNAIMTPSTLTNEQIDAVLEYCNNSQ